MTPPDRPTFSTEQLGQYLRHIKFPAKEPLPTPQSVQALPFEKQIDLVNTLLRHHLVYVPFENLDLHYSPLAGITLDESFLFDKVVSRNVGRGGYCMQNNGIFATLLRTLGLHVTSFGARVSKAFEAGSHDGVEEVEYGGYGHRVNMITLSNGNKYFCDVGFGAAGPTFLIPLKDGFTRYLTGTADRPAASMKIARGFAANTTNRVPESLLWIYCVKYGASTDTTKPWIPCYSFSENEFFPADFIIMSHAVSTSRSSLFVNNVLVQRSILSDDGDTIIGDVTLFGKEVKERKWGESKVAAECKTENDRVQALKAWFGISLRDDEVAGIRGLPTEIR